MLGDGKWNSGDQGSFYKYQFGVLKLLDAINNNIAPVGGLATEATLLQVLAALQNGQEFEQNLVIDTGDPACPSCPTYLQVRIWDTVTHTFGSPRYFDANGVEFFIGGNPLYGPMQIVNPQVVLNNILTQLTAINGNTTGINLEATQLAIQGLLTTLNGLVATEVTLASALVTLNAINAKLANDYGAAASAVRTASQIGNATGAADFGAGVTTAQTLRVVLPTNQTVIPVSLPTGVQAITSSVEINSVNSPVTAGATSVGFTTDSTFVGTINGVARNSSTFYGFEAEPGKTLPAIAFTVTAGSMIIDKIV